MKAARIIILTLLALIAGAPLASALMSPPTGGESIAAEIGAPYPAVVAHRGFSWNAPEETAAAYLLAREIGADYLEGDVQRSRDGVLFLFHDDDLKRTTNVEELFPDRQDATPDQFTWAELQRLDAGSWFNEKFPDRARPSYVGVKILSMSEFLDIAESGKNKPGMYLETKSASRYPGIESQLTTLLTQRGWIGPNTASVAAEPGAIAVRNTKARVIFQSFEKPSLELFRQLAPEVPRVYLVGVEEKDAQGWDALLRDAKDVGHGIGPSGYLGWPNYTGPAHKAGLLVHTYTINAVWQMRLISFFGADGLFTDRADLALVFYGRSKPIDLGPIFNAANL
jgi:glycerophosphoryl diester phosphodiesterase